MKKVIAISLIILSTVILAAYIFNQQKNKPTNLAIINQQKIITPTNNTISTNNNFSSASLAQHKTINDCYLAINNNVYDVSSYINYHPGGANMISSRCGQEVSGIFASIHSNRAWDLLAKYKIGILTK